MQSSFSLKHKVAIVTGGSQGIGRAVVDRFKAHGATVVNADLSAPDASVADLFIRTDVASESAVVAMLDKTFEEFGRIDVLVNNAGINPEYASIADASLDDFVRCFKVNTLGVAAGLKHAARHMTSGGSIINISSMAANMGVPGLAAYAASKLPVVGLTRTAAIEMGPKGIRVNAICPSSVRTPMALADGGEELLEVESRAVPLGRIAEPEEVAALAHFLAADDCGFLNGQAINLCGGMSAGWSEMLWEKLAQ